MLVRLALRFILSALCATGPAAASAQTPTIVDVYARARALVEASVAAHGGAAALDAVQSVRIVIEGDQFWRHQSRRPDPPYDRERERYELLLDLPNGRAVSQSWTTYPGGAHRNTGFITDGQRGFSIDYRRGTHTVVRYPPGVEQTGHLYYLPQLLPQFVLKDLAGAGRTVRWLGRLRLASGTEVDAVSAVIRGSLVTVGFDVETRRLRATLGLGNDLLVGDTAVEVELLDYADRNGVLMPTRRVVRSSQGVLRDMRFEVVEPGYVIPANRLFPPDGSRDLTSQPALDPVRVVAPGVWALGGDSASLAVEFADHVLVVDAPSNSSEVLSRLATLAPGKPVRYVIPSHHHGDHSGGAAQFAGAGATVVTTPGNRAFMTQLVRTVPQARVELIEGDVRVFEDAGRRVEIHHMKGGPHADEMLVVWLPALGLLFQSDLIDVDATGDTPPGTNNETTVHFASWLRQKGWQVKTYAGAHGFLPSPDAFEALVKAPILPLR